MVKLPVPDEHLKGIGEITVSFALLELNLQLLAGSLINEHQRLGRIITAQLSFRNLRALVISLYKERHGEDDDFKTLKKLVKKAEYIEDTRNNITHSIWAVGKDKDYITRSKTTAKEKKGLSFQFQQFSASDLKELADKIKSCSDEVIGFRTQLLSNGKAVNNPIDKLW